MTLVLPGNTRQEKRLRAYAEAIPAMVNPFDLHVEIKRKNFEIAGNRLVVKADAAPGLESGQKLDIVNWLKFAAPVYEISPNLTDYVMVPVILFTSDLPNRNGVGFPLDQLTRFNPDMGMSCYKTWKGKPTHFEHANKDIKKAKGVIADVSLRKVVGFSDDKLWKVVALLCFDRTKDPALAKSIMDRKLNTYSMGAFVDAFTCSYCGQRMGKCPHLDPNSPINFYMKNGQLVFCQGVMPIGFETSGVVSPAYSIALNDEWTLGL